MAALHTLLADPPDGPKPVVVRHRIMREYMPKRGTLGHDMMFRSCTIQVRHLGAPVWCLRVRAACLLGCSYCAVQKAACIVQAALHSRLA